MRFKLGLESLELRETPSGSNPVDPLPPSNPGDLPPAQPPATPPSTPPGSGPVDPLPPSNPG